MKKVLMIFLLAIMPSIMLGQSFTFHSDQLEFSTTVGSSFDHFTEIKNTSDQNLSLMVIRVQNDLPDGWSSSLCIGDLCFQSTTDTIDASRFFGELTPDSTLDFHLLTSTHVSQTGTGSITIKIQNTNDPADSVSLTFTFNTIVTSLEKNENTPADFKLYQNFPNPFNPQTHIEYFLPQGDFSQTVSLAIFNQIGQKVRQLVKADQSPGAHEVSWNGTDDKGNHVAAGLYFYILRYGNISQQRKMLLLK
jgi:hypothetical protein